MSGKTHGITQPDERSVAVVVWTRVKGGGLMVDIDDHARKYVFVPEVEANKFEDACAVQGWKITMVGYDHWLDRRTYAVEYIPPRDFQQIDLTTNKGVLAINKAAKHTPKRFNTSGLREKVLKAMDMATGVAMGAMEEVEAEGGNKVIRGAELAANLARTMATIESVNVNVEQHREKMDNIAEGKPTEIHGVKTYKIDADTEGQV